MKSWLICCFLYCLDANCTNKPGNVVVLTSPVKSLLDFSAVALQLTQAITEPGCQTCCWQQSGWSFSCLVWSNNTVSLPEKIWSLDSITKVSQSIPWFCQWMMVLDAVWGMGAYKCPALDVPFIFIHWSFSRFLQSFNFILHRRGRKIQIPSNHSMRIVALKQFSDFSSHLLTRQRSSASFLHLKFFHNIVFHHIIIAITCLKSSFEKLYFVPHG